MLKPSPLFTFKHYASVIRVLRATRFDSNAVTYDQYHAALDQWQEIVNAFASMFAADNPRFKRDLFVAECNREEATK